MKANELNITCKHAMQITKPEHNHYAWAIQNGVLIPTTKNQAIAFQKATCLSVLGAADVTMIESVMNKHGLAGEYKRTKSGHWARLLNLEDYKRSLAKEFNI